MRPPLLVAPLDHLPPEDRPAFEKNVEEIGVVDDGQTVACPFPIALYHRIDGIWLPVSDLGAFHSAPSASDVKREPVESSYAPPHLVVDND